MSEFPPTNGRLDSTGAVLRFVVLVAVAIALLAGLIAVAWYESLRERERLAFESLSREQAELLLDALQPGLSEQAVTELVGNYRQFVGADVVAVVGGTVVTSRPQLDLNAIPASIRIQQTGPGFHDTETSVEGMEYLVIAGSSRPDVELYVLLPTKGSAGATSELKGVFVGWWAAVVALTVLVALWVGLCRFRALARARERERRLTADIAHEIRTPLGTIVTAASMLDESEDDLPPRLRRPVSVLVTESRRLRSLIEDILELARLEAGDHSVHLELVSVASLVTAALATRGWEDEVEVDLDDGATVMADRMCLNRIVLNLVENALDHGRAGVRLSVRRVRSDSVLEVADAGPGISPEDLPHVFDPFFTGDSRGSGRRRGLGLRIAKENAELLGGRLHVESTPGAGTVFVLTLPAAEPVEVSEPA